MPSGGAETLDWAPGDLMWGCWARSDKFLDFGQLLTFVIKKLTWIPVKSFQTHALWAFNQWT